MKRGPKPGGGSGGPKPGSGRKNKGGLAHDEPTYEKCKEQLKSDLIERPWRNVDLAEKYGTLPATVGGWRKRSDFVAELAEASKQSFAETRRRALTEVDKAFSFLMEIVSWDREKDLPPGTNDRIKAAVAVVDLAKGVYKDDENAELWAIVNQLKKEHAGRKHVNYIGVVAAGNIQSQGGPRQIEHGGFSGNGSVSPGPGDADGEGGGGAGPLADEGAPLF